MTIDTRGTALTIIAIALASVVTFADGTGADQVPAGQASASPVLVETLRLEVPFQGGTSEFIDLGNEGLGAGDLFVGSDLPVRDPATGKRIGSMDGWEIILSARHNGSVAGSTSLRLSRGNVAIDGMVRHADVPNVFTVTGGSGSYTGVGGTLTILRENTRRKVVIMRLELVS